MQLLKGSRESLVIVVQFCILSVLVVTHIYTCDKTAQNLIQLVKAE